MPPHAVDVDWQVAGDPGMSSIVATGTTRAGPELAHAVHVEVAGLRPGREYWYRFRADGHLSSVGRTRTLPGLAASPERVRFAFASCQHWASGRYAAYRDMADGDLDFVVHLGDYVYEDAVVSDGGVRGEPVPAELGTVCATLERWRLQYALYRSDLDLQRAHASAPWFVTWDDHEVVNNYAGDTAPPVGDISGLRAAAYQAWYEHQPLRRRSRRAGGGLRMHRRAALGSLGQLDLLDGRQHRTPPACGWGDARACREHDDPAATMLGEQQERWLYKGLRSSQARWNILASNVMLAGMDRDGDAGTSVRHDSWDGYPAARARLISAWEQTAVRNPVVITGDCHATFVNDVVRFPGRPDSPVVATEFVGTSITSVGRPDIFEPMLRHNPHIRFADGHRRGYLRCTVDRTQWRTDVRTVADVSRADSDVATTGSFVVEDGRPGAHPEG